MSQVPGNQPDAGDARLAQAWHEASQEEPPAALDDAIRAAARQAVHARPRPVGASPFGGRWRVPLSVAALLVVSATVTLLVAERDKSDKSDSPALHDHTPPTAMSLPQADTRESTSNLSPAPAQQLEKRNAPPTLTSAAPRERETEQGLQERKDLSPLPAPSAATADKLQAVVPPAVPPASELSPSKPARGEADHIEMPRAAKEQAEAANGAPAPAAAPPTERADESSRDAAGIPVDEPVADLTKREEHPAARAKQGLAEKTVPAAPILAPQRFQDASAARAAPRAATAGPPGNTSAESAAAPAAEGLEPKAWLDRILELRHQGKLEEADKSLKAFRERYPTYPLPPELKSSP